jgi:steroid delta-isomerase-like uncharacterized protein
MAEDLKERLRSFYAAMSAGDFDAVDEFIADDFVDHEEFPGITPDKEGARQFFMMMRTAFPDLQLEAHEIIADGDLVAARATFRGTHDGEFMGVPATGRQINVNGMDMVRIRDGKATEHWGVMDAMTMMQQLGAIPEQAPA